MDRHQFVVCCKDIRLRDCERPRRIKHVHGGKIVAVPLEFGEPALLLRFFHVAEEKRNRVLVRFTAAALGDFVTTRKERRA